MFGGSSAPPVPVDASASIASSENRFSLIELRRIYTQLVENKSVNEDNKSLVVEILRIIAEMVVYGDNKSELLFDFFCEKNMLSLFLEIMWTESGCPSAVHIQILQTLSILINCVRNDTSLYYLLSNNYINEIIIYPFAFASDENLCDQFASFMKSLSLKLNIQTVQFFFIEDTGAFPILTRAIGLLDLAAEPMVRISSQATILNVYKVDDSRAREYALQEEVMHSLFVNVVKLMQNQHSTISGICVAYFTESIAGNDETKLNRLENQLEDILASTEDWFYYLQDILDLKILVLRQALIHHLINEFVYPCLLQPVLQYRASAGAAERKSGDKVASGSPSKSSGAGSSSQFTSDLVMRTMEIEFGDEEAVPPSNSTNSSSSSSSTGHSKSLLANLMRGSASSPESLELQSRALAMNSAMVYLLQMLRFITDPLLQRAVLVTLYHPVNQTARSALIATKTPLVEAATSEVITTAANGDVKTDGDVTTSSEAETVIVSDASSSGITEEDVNPFGDTLKRIAATGAAGSSNQKLVLTSVFMFHLLCTGLIAGNPSRTVEGESYFATDLLSALQMVRLLQCMHILPSGGDCSCLADEEVAIESSGGIATVSDNSIENGSDSAVRGGTKNDRHKHHRNSRKAPYSAIPQHSYDADPDLLSLDSLRKIRALSGIGDADGPSQRPLLAVYMDVLRYPGNHSLTAFQVAAHCVFAIGNLIHDGFVSGSDASQRESGTPLLAWLLNELKSAVKYAALTLLVRTDGPQSEVLLNLVREEMRRYEGRKWKTVAFRMYGDILLFLPATNTNMRRLGIDFDIPISQAESIRKDIQCFLILRALYTHVVTLSQFSKDTTHTADLCSTIKDATFLSLDEVNVLPSHIADGLSYDMRGKRFLDSVLIHSGATQQQLASDKSSSESTSSGGSSLASILSLGYLGGGSRRSSTGNSSTGGAATPPRSSKRYSTNAAPSDAKGGVVVVAGAHQNILFIQEPTILLLISQDKTHTKIGFKVFAAVPLLYTDAKIDPDDRKRFKVLVRSWKPLPQMCRVEPEGVSTCDDADATASGSGAGAQQSQHRTRRGWQTESYRKASERSTFWSLTLAMETEQACMLAVQHIENKRQELFAQKMTRLKSILRCWASDTPADDNAVVINRST